MKDETGVAVPFSSFIPHPSSLSSTLLARSEQSVRRDNSGDPQDWIGPWSRSGSLRNLHNVARLQLKVLDSAFADVPIIEPDCLRLRRIGIHVSDDRPFLLFCVK